MSVVLSLFLVMNSWYRYFIGKLGMKCPNIQDKKQSAQLADSKVIGSSPREV